MVERLLVVAHGTASRDGSATTARLVAAIAVARPAVAVDLCFLDVAVPRLPDVLDERPTVLVPLLLSTGFHVQSDIPAAVGGRDNIRVARHLGPDPLLTDVLADRLDAAAPAATTVLVGSGSSRPEARAELDAAAAMLGERLARPVQIATIGEDLAARFASFPAPIQVATYLLTEGLFLSRLREANLGRGTVAGPLGVHAALVELVWRRYDDACGTR